MRAHELKSNSNRSTEFEQARYVKQKKIQIENMTSKKVYDMSERLII